MVIAALEVRLRIPGAHSLKEKRRVIKSMKDRFAKLNLSVSEVDDNDKWQSAVLGLALVTNDAGFASSVMDRVILDMEDAYEAEMVDVKREIIHL
ncbi:MAG TPA: DUF503 domain-containing protein [Deltaproteobacteria bacterium]|nr:DUF503 domain-containing protein [Deltaproteobacteria bacterium]HOM28578.1 DUF503 domain-containing protein [Deltaproteobacteria bacterium]HPP81545.1 DUF503 domain-containing protein [Deltaproteobacteria bacterium]